MTKTGFGFIAAGGFIYLVANQTQIGWLYLFDAILWSLLVLSVIMPGFSLKSLQVERQIILPDYVQRQSQLVTPLEDEIVEVRLKLSNNSRLPRHFIKVFEDCPFVQPEKRGKAFLIASLKPRSVTSVSYAATCYRRGHYPSSSITLESGGPLGLMVRRRTFRVPLNLTVYPAYYPMETLPPGNAAWADTSPAIRSRAANEFYGSREYQPGEPLKHIHWRNTARVGRFMLKEFEQASQGSIAVAFETRPDFGEGKETTLEYSIKIAASLVKLCADSGRSIDLLAGETPLYHATWTEAMDYLARLEGGGKASWAELTSASEPGQTLVVIVPMKKAKLVSTLMPLEERSKKLVVVLLEGFTPDETPSALPSRLRADNLSIIHCLRGGLEETIKKLDNSLLLAASFQSR